jgi:hypothetical protein
MDPQKDPFFLDLPCTFLLSNAPGLCHYLLGNLMNNSPELQVG